MEEQTKANTPQTKTEETCDMEVLESDKVSDKNQNNSSQIPAGDNQENEANGKIADNVSNMGKESCPKESTPKANEDDKVNDMEMVEFKIVFNKKKYDISFGLDDTVGALKVHLQDIISVPSTMQKIMIKGLAKDEMSLRKLGVVKGSKVMVIGSTLNDVLEVAKKPTPQQIRELEKEEKKTESWSQMKIHKKVLERGKPEDAMVGIKNTREGLPQHPLSGMLNKSGGKVRLTFKMEVDQVWLGTKERTEKLPMNSIKAVTSEPIEGHEEYHIIALQLGPTEASRYFIYWVPAQYVESIKESVLGKWQYF